MSFSTDFKVRIDSLNKIRENDKLKPEEKGERIFNLFKGFRKGKTIKTDRWATSLNSPTSGYITKKHRDFYSDFNDAITNCINQIEKAEQLISLISTEVDNHNKYIISPECRETGYNISQVGKRQLSTFFLMLCRPNDFIYLPNALLDYVGDPHNSAGTPITWAKYNEYINTLKSNNKFESFLKLCNDADEQPSNGGQQSNSIKITSTDGGQQQDFRASLNVILYGPPGTGKTYNTIVEALNILDGNLNETSEYSDKKIRFDELKSEGRIKFVTFHQSFSYEDFVEGIRAETDDVGNLRYSVKDGVFKKIAIEALYNKFEQEIQDEETYINTLWNVANSKIKVKVKAEFDYSNYEHKKIILTTREKSDFEKSSGKPYVLIIDEINRGNTSRVFGELITLIETTKRAGSDEAMDAILPYSQETFTVPDNLYIIGTMNTADRSLALMDTALRRRFDFIEMMPDPKKVDFKVEGIKIKEMLETINDRIEALYDREHTIGHAFFMKLTSESKVSELELIFKNNILPLLEEYFFEDWDKIIKILGDSNIYTQKNSANLGFTHTGKNYSRNYASLKDSQTYIKIYNSKDNNTNQDQTA
jgi:AAA domain (dynein-related subfamily)